MDLTTTKVAILGAGTMGYGIAQVFAAAGQNVQLYDPQVTALSRAIQLIENQTAKAVEKAKMTASQRMSILQNIAITSNIHDIEAGLIIEAVPEQLRLKQDLFIGLEAQLKNQSPVFATNTSSLSVTAIASVLKRPERCIGLHFFNPAPVMRLVEVVAGEATDPFLVEQVSQLVAHLGKVAAVVQDQPGFIVNRVARFYYLESLRIAHSQVADIGAIDRLMESSGFRMGPFRLMDLIGVDTNHSVTQAIYDSFYQEPRFRPSIMQQKKVEAGHFGVKAKRGFYTYP